MYNKLVLSGGGIKGGMYIGMCKYLEEKEIIFEYLNEIIGTSIGAFFGLLIVLGYTSDELKQFFLTIDFEELKDFKLNNIEKGFGFDDGSLLNDMIKNFITQKKFNENITMENLYQQTKINLVVCSYNVNEKCATFFSKKDHPDLPVFLAVRMSMNIPLLFCAVKYKENLYVDGGIICNIPIKYLIQTHTDKKKLKKILSMTLCVSFEELPNDSINVIDTIENYLYNILKSGFHSIECEDKKYIKKKQGNLLILQTKQVTTGDFRLTEEQKKLLFEMGYKFTKEFIESKLILH